VDFTTAELQKMAVGLSEKLLEGRKLLIKLGECIPQRRMWADRG
jgi:hypothetical protein